MNISPSVNYKMLLFIALCLNLLSMEYYQTSRSYCYDVEVIIHDGKSARYKSGGVVYTESLEAGHWKVQSWALDDKTDPRPWVNLEDAFSITVKINPDLPTPTPLNEGWNWVSGKQSPGEREKQIVSVVELANDQQPITVKVKTLLDGTPVLTRWLEVTNTSDQIMALSTLKPWTGTLWEDDAQVYLGYSTRWHVPWEGWFGWREITRGCNIIENRQGLVWDDPFFVLRNINRSEYFFGQLAWPANYRIEFHRDSGISFSTGPISVNELRVIYPRETIISPAVHLGLTHGSFDDSVQAMHQHIRRSVIPPQNPEIAFRVQCLFPEDQPLSLYHGKDCNEENLSRFLDVCAECGIELFILDGPTWARGYGDWVAKEAWFPNGLEPLIQHARNKGMLFGVYAEVEGGRGEWRNTQAYRDHPEWFLFRNPDYPLTNFINIANDSAADYVEKELKDLLTRYPLDLYRHDQNGCFGNEGSITRRHGFLENDYWRYYDNWHGIIDRSRELNPRRIFQQASGSGSRLELATLAHWNENYTSDRVSYPHVFQMVSGLSVYLPPEVLVTPFGMAGPNQPDPITILRGSFALGQVPLLFNAMLPKNQDELTTEIKHRFLHYVNLYKSFFRPLLSDLKVYHHAPVNESGGVETGDWFAMEFTSPDKKQGWATIIRLHGDSVNSYHFVSRGLDPQKSYMVTMDNDGVRKQQKGRDLLERGITVSISNTLQSELILFEEK